MKGDFLTAVTHPRPELRPLAEEEKTNCQACLVLIPSLSPRVDCLDHKAFYGRSFLSRSEKSGKEKLGDLNCIGMKK